MDEKVSTLEKGKPQPDMPKLSMSPKQGRKTITRLFCAISERTTRKVTTW